VILARIDRLQPEAHDVLTAASVLGRQFGLPLLEAVSSGERRRPAALIELQRLDLVAREPPLARARVPLQARADPGQPRTERCVGDQRTACTARPPSG
jgi:hypothetical protein